jgi:hypothetical protein
MTDDQIKEVVLKAEMFISAFEKLSDSLSDEDKARIVQSASGPVGLRDINKFHVAVSMPSHAELKQARRDLIGAISAEKWLEGFAFAIQIMLLIGGGPCGGATTTCMP